MKIIIKQPIDKKEWSTIFCVGDIACEKGGAITNTVLEKMKSDGIIQEMDREGLFENNFKHEELLNDAKDHNYLEISKG